MELQIINLRKVKWVEIQNYFVLLLGTNIGGVLNLVMGIYVLKVAREQEFNVFNAYMGCFMILTSVSKVAKYAFTLYGADVASVILVGLRRYFYLIIPATLSLLALAGWGVAYYSNGSLFASLLLILAAISQVALLISVGIIQHRQVFISSTLLVLAQNLLKVLLGIYLFTRFGNTGIWFAALVASFLAVYGARFILPNKGRLNTREVKMPDIKQLALSLVIFLCVEIMFNLDTILVSHRLSVADAHLYNTLGILERSALMAIFGISAVILSQANDTVKLAFESLRKNILVAGILGVIVFIASLILKPFVMDFLDIPDWAGLNYFKFIFAGIIFSIALLVLLWFASLESIRLKILALCGCGVFIGIFWYFLASLDQGINLFIGLTLGMIVYLGMLLRKVEIIQYQVGGVSSSE